MAQRQQILDLVEAINKRKEDITKLSPAEQSFFYDIESQSSHYGFSFSDKQLKWLCSIYRKIYSVEA
jgi:hypothetical protein